MKPTKVRIQSLVQPYVQEDEQGKYLSFSDAELLIDQILKEYEGITCRYNTYYPGCEELLITSIRGTTEFFSVRIKK